MQPIHFFLPCAFLVWGCEKSTFTRNKVLLMLRTNRTFAMQLSGCIKPSENMKDAVRIVIVHQRVRVIHEGAVQGLDHLTDLDLSGNGVEELHGGAFQSLPSLSTLYLSHNRIENITRDVFNHLQVEMLFLDHNLIEWIDEEAFDDMPRIVHVSLANNKIAAWNPMWFSECSLLNALVVANNSIEELPEEAFRNLNATVRLLDFTSNDISYVHPRALLRIKQIGTMLLEDNELDEMSSLIFEDVKQLDRLTLNKNNIRCLSDMFLENLNHIEVLNVEDNPLTCDCLKRIGKFKEEHEEVDVKINTPTC